ncbi:MAG TPA: penicillin-binding protein 2 [Acidimicrobiales bacterium]|nr:penicillin-binding protein 2 [Acidimicrobiales bacterium]
MSTHEQESPLMRLTILLVVVACLFAALFARLWFLQVVNAPNAQAAAQNNGIRLIYIPAPRGEILDRNGNVLVGDVNVPVIEVSREVAAQNPDMVARLAPLLNMTAPQLQRAIDNVQYSPYAPVPVLRNASPQQILYIQENQSLFPGVQATSVTQRSYTPMGLAAANVVGYVGQVSDRQLKKLKGQGYQPGDEIGLAGIESSYESILRGTPGVEKVQVDSRGDVLTTLSVTKPVPGLNLRLSIDGNIQLAAETALNQGMVAARHTFDAVTRRNFQAPAGSAVVEDPNTGQIIALATNPTYDPSQFVGGISEANYQALLNNPSDPLLDRSIQGQYAPGSTFKLVTGTAGLQYGLITPNYYFNDTGRLMIGNFPAHNDNYESYGEINLPKAITVSSDLFFDNIGVKLWYGRTQYGDDALQSVAKSYGLGTQTGIALPDEAPGRIPTPESYVRDHQRNPTAFPNGQWFPGDSQNTAIGQGEVLVTPLQLANAYATFANGGKVMVPQLALDAETATGHVVQSFSSKVFHTVDLQPAWRAALLAGFEGVVNNPKGTAYGVFAGTPLVAHDIAGKTGTATQVAPKQDTSVFTSFAPASNPQYVVDSFVEDAGYGASVAAPVVREIYDALFAQPLQPVSYSAAGSGGQN